MGFWQKVGIAVAIAAGTRTTNRIVDYILPDRSIRFSEYLQEREVATKEKKANNDTIRTMGKVRHDDEVVDLKRATLVAKHGPGILRYLRRK